MMIKICFALLALCSVYPLFGQGVGVNESGLPPYPGAVLDVHSSTKGVLLPRTDTLGIADPHEGMIIYDTVTQVFHYYNGTQWLALLTSQSFRFWWLDKDGDGYGNKYYVTYALSPPAFYVDNDGDCDDDNAQVNPLATDFCDGLDNNCNGNTDEGDPMLGLTCGSDVGECDTGLYVCIAGELICWGEVPPSPEICDGKDNDCNGLVDDILIPLPCHVCQGANGWVLNLVNQCYIAGICYSEGQYNPNNPCERCYSQVDPYQWSFACFGPQVCCDDGCKNVQTDPNNCGDCGIVCDDGNPCTTDLCIDGECISEYLPQGTPCPGGECDGAGNCIPE